MRRLAAVTLLAAASCLTFAAQAQTDPSFLLTATSKDLDAYFPTYLANGYLSTMTAPRGTESNLAYLVAFMDYTQDDIARPAAIPGWSGINYSAGQSTAGQFWLNDVKVGSKAFKDYSQTLNMHDGTLTTSYRYNDPSNKSTDIKVVTFASQAAPHLAVTQISITPDFTGTVQLVIGTMPVFATSGDSNDSKTVKPKAIVCRFDSTAFIESRLRGTER